MPIKIDEITGAAELHDWFGYWPDFHDAEIMSLHLNRAGSSVLRLHTWETSKEVDHQGNYVQKKHLVVELGLNNISELDLHDFNNQNVISGLIINRSDSGFRLQLGACYGLAGFVEAEKISIRITPGHPAPA
jgi:hypothetical protein